MAFVMIILPAISFSEGKLFSFVNYLFKTLITIAKY
jgi:hypothetical protein